MAVHYNITRFESGSTVVTAFIDGQAYTVSGENQMFGRIVDKLINGDESVKNDFDLANLANQAFHEVTDRVSVRNGRVYLDENPVDEAMSQLVVDYLMEGNENLLPLVRFLELLDDNPSHRSRNQLWNFVRTHGIHIDDDGYLVMYKSVIPVSDKNFKSVASGEASVNGVVHKGQIPSAVGDIVSMPRRDISDDPTKTCHVGLHCGARSYADGFFGGAGRVTITVRVNPAHVVCIPDDHGWAKVRVEQYQIMDVAGAKRDTVRWVDENSEDYDEYDDEDYDF